MSDEFAVANNSQKPTKNAGTQKPESRIMADQSAYKVITEFLQSVEASDDGHEARDEGGGDWLIVGEIRIDRLAKKIESWALWLTEYQKSMIALREDEDRDTNPKP